MMHYAWDFSQSETERNFEWIISHFIERFHSRGLHLCEFFGTKERVCIRKEFNSQRIGLGHQHGRRFIVVGHQHGRRFTVVGHQYGRRDVMWKHSISWKLFLVSFSVLWKPPFLHPQWRRSFSYFWGVILKWGTARNTFKVGMFCCVLFTAGTVAQYCLERVPWCRVRECFISPFSSRYNVTKRPQVKVSFKY